MRLLFPIETGSRELLPKLFLAAKLAERGHPSFLGSKSNINRIMKYITSFAYFDKGYHKGVSDLVYETIRTQKGYIISIDEENSVDYEDYFTALQRFPNESFDFFDLIFLWGQKQADILREKISRYDENKVVVSGHPRFELLKKEYRFLYDNQVRKIKSKYGDFILINTSFSLGNHVRGEDFILTNYKGRIPYLRDTISYEKKQIQYFIELVSELVKYFDMNIIVRPHPEEKHSIYLNRFEDFDNVFVEYEYSVIPWILSSEVLIHHSCTTAVEASMMDKIPISYCYDVNMKLIPWIPIVLSEKFNSIKGIINYIKEGKHKSKNIVNSKILNEHFNYFENTTELIVKKVDSFCVSLKDQMSCLEKPILTYIMKSRIKEVGKKFFSYLKLWREDELSSQKLKGLNKNEISFLYNELKNKELIDSNLKIKKINNKLYEIFKC